MTDNEIIKALECCSYYDVCLNCPCFSFCGCTPELLESALDLINRQKAEIKRLAKLLDDKCDRCIAKEREEAVKEFSNELQRVFAGHSDYHGDTILTKLQCLAEGKAIKYAEPIDTSNIKAEAVKEFAERLKERGFSDKYYEHEAIVYVADIDNLVKEMVDENND